MRKGIVLVGFALLVISIIVSLFVLPTAIAPPYYSQTMTLVPGQFQYINFNVSNSTQLFIFSANFSTPINFFVFSKKGFDTWRVQVTSKNSTNGFSYAEKLEGNGTLAIYKDVSTFFVSAQQVSSNGNTIFSANDSSYNSNFTFVFQNANGSMSNSNIAKGAIKYIPPLSLSNLEKNNKVSSYFYLVGGLEFTFIIIAIVGIGLMVYGFIKKPKETIYTNLKSGGKLAEAVKERDELYKNISSKKQNNKTKKGKNEPA